MLLLFSASGLSDQDSHCKNGPAWIPCPPHTGWRGTSWCPHRMQPMKQRVFLQRKIKELRPEEEEWMLEAKPLGNRCRRKPGGPPSGSSAWLQGLLDWSPSLVRNPRSASPSSSDPQKDLDGFILWASFYLRFSLGGPGGAQLPSCSWGQIQLFLLTSICWV